MLACEICSRTSDREREIENLREDREAILTIDASESKEECCDALEVLARHHDDCESSLRSMGVASRDGQALLSKMSPNIGGETDRKSNFEGPRLTPPLATDPDGCPPTGAESSQAGWRWSPTREDRKL